MFAILHLRPFERTHARCSPIRFGRTTPNWPTRFRLLGLVNTHAAVRVVPGLPHSPERAVSSLSGDVFFGDGRYEGAVLWACYGHAMGFLARGPPLAP